MFLQASVMEQVVMSDLESDAERRKSSTLFTRIKQIKQQGLHVKLTVVTPRNLRVEISSLR